MAKKNSGASPGAPTSATKKLGGRKEYTAPTDKKIRRPRPLR
jgi:hypothetical protein